MKWFLPPLLGYVFGVLFTALRLLVLEAPARRPERATALRIALSWPLWCVAAFAIWGWPWRWPKNE